MPSWKAAVNGIGMHYVTRENETQSNALYSSVLSVSQQLLIGSTYGLCIASLRQVSVLPASQHHLASANPDETIVGDFPDNSGDSW